MSGHSHWSTIKHQKGAADSKRSKLYSKLSFAISMAVREGSGNTDPNSNPRLRLAVERAQAANLTKDKIKKAIMRGTGIGKEGNISKAKFGGTVLNNVALIIEAETDNKNRTTASIRHVLGKSGGRMVSPESVEPYFKVIGKILITSAGRGEEELIELAITVGADDVKLEGETADVISNAKELGNVRKKLEERGVEVQYVKQEYITKIPMPLTDEGEINKLDRLIKELEENEDVATIYTNADYTAEAK
ncbi:YebC/PmpR family DNA-binding transcriptional regulator [Candidatus Microgenomates bacterium]|nr:YebC/PmpR family DNA-binding transcriptional regulator [Candidatus Microgenomates bacterium]